MDHYYVLALTYALLLIINIILIPQFMLQQWNWKKLLIDVIKVVVGAIAGWLGAGTII